MGDSPIVALLSLVLIFPVSAQSPAVDVQLLGKLVFSTKHELVITPGREEEENSILTRNWPKPSFLDLSSPFLGAATDWSFIIPSDAMQ